MIFKIVRFASWFVVLKVDGFKQFSGGKWIFYCFGRTHFRCPLRTKELG